MIIAYLILAHENPEQLGRLIDALPVESPVFVHLDARASTAVAARIGALVERRRGSAMVLRHACYWGDIGIVRGTVEMMGALVRSGRAFDYATLLSGADYPIKSNAAIASVLAASGGTEFIEAFHLDRPNRWSGQDDIFNAPDRIRRFHLRVRKRILRTPFRRSVPYDMQPYGGDQWWTLTERSLRYAVDFLERHPGYLRFMRNCVIPDELFMQTILMNGPTAGRIAGTARRLVLWDRPERPAMLGVADIDLLAKSDCLFARKFDQRRDPAILDMIDERLLRPTPPHAATGAVDRSARACHAL